jgi:hypothetical protein
MNILHLSIRIPSASEVSYYRKKYDIKDRCRHSVAVFEQFYIYLVTFLQHGITYAKWSTCKKYFDEIKLDYYPFVIKNYQKNVNYYKKICDYHISIKNILEILHAKSYSCYHDSSPTLFDWS